MKKTVITLAVVAFAAAAVQATTTSANIVGYIKNSYTQGSSPALSMKGIPFTASANNTVSELLGSTLPLGTVVYTFDGAIYSSVSFGEITERQGSFPNFVDVVVGTNWTENGTSASSFSLNAGQGAWIVLPAGSDSYETISAGSVEVAASADTSINAGLNLLASHYASSAVVTNMGFQASVGDTIYVFNGAGYDSVSYGEITERQGSFPNFVDVVVGTNWTENGSSVSDFSINMGSGFWYDSAGSQTWSQPRPYSVD